MEHHPLRRLIQLVSSANYSRTFSLLVLLLIIAAVPFTVFVSQQRQELRQRAEHLDNDYACNRPGQVQVGEDVGDCDAGNGCTGNLYARYDHTPDTDGDGTADPNDPDDQPYCVNTVCSEPITCPAPTPEPTATPRYTCHDVDNPYQFCMETATCAASNYVDGSGTCPENQHCCKLVLLLPTPRPTAVPNAPVPNTPVPNTPIPPPAIATPGTGGPSCLPWTESNCSEPGGTRCSNWGISRHCGWTQAKWDTCRFTTCASATPVPNTPVSTVGPGTPIPPISPLACIQGDARIPCNGCVDLLDYNQWVSEYIIEQVHRGVSQRLANFDGTGGVDLADYAVWANQYISHPERRCP